MNDIIARIRDVRINLSILLGFVNAIGVQTRQTALSATDIQRSKARLGVSIKFLDEQNPYPESMNPESPVIEPEVDVEVVPPPEDFMSFDTVGRVKYVRRELQSKVIDEIAMIKKLVNASGEEGYPESVEFLTQAWVSAIDAKGWLGYELGNIGKQMDNLKAK